MASLSVQSILIAFETLVIALGQELLAILPFRLQVHFGSHRWQIISDLETANGSVLSPDRPVALLLPTEEVLLRRIELPLVSWLQLGSLMKYEAPRHIPIPLDRACFDFRTISRDLVASRMCVELAVVRSETVEDIMRRAAGFGIGVEALCASVDQGIWVLRHLSRRSWREILLTQRRFRLWLRVLMPVLAAIAWILAAQSWATRLEQSRNSKVEIVRTQAEGIEPLRQKLTVQNDTLTFLANARTGPSTAKIIEEVARLLPDDAWLQEIHIGQSSLQLRGVARHATDLLRIFTSSSLFSNVQFEAPLTEVPGSGGTQFDLTMDVDKAAQ